MTNEAFAPAKINLTLHVTGQRPDGYHLLDSLVVFADIGDRLWFEQGPELSLEVTGPFAKGVPCDARNLVWQAAFQAGWSGQITLEKNLPHGAGIGGGSADAAAVLRSLDAPQHALCLGADVPVCLSTFPQRMSGIGEQLCPVPDLPEMWVVLVNPGVHVPTPQVFAGLASKQNPAMPDSLEGWQSVQTFATWLAHQRNDLQAVAQTQTPEISEVLSALGDALIARMSGSGATCFGVYSSAAMARLAAEKIRKQHSDWWVADGKVLS
ncbi:4-(cytidine 5'-diphospho)-2-C-methyl-D-erythritol kinase [Sulfitobacter sp. SK012]|uniref:4-(cytidine 5'-diphospho)-2-C-methyl-D-erythritol kinase n=1 Tax=Sulfitobacter sp. SK012 TaxID=1389005 RepID=UPI000E0A30F4|nr:4-(cytidine 5'-diphospho)-2-C-methyl-D-erythritol kinase [Sulfitobacter sp. SK012]AXI45326.1 4-(cytidine 5'-diphospho)-2-C-methyl-D-erythritol kinase [Sulfitobacter sp. SK012]